jgi:hypothetical protein
MEGKFSSEGLQAINEEDDILMAMARAEFEGEAQFCRRHLWIDQQEFIEGRLSVPRPAANTLNDSLCLCGFLEDLVAIPGLSGRIFKNGAKTREIVLFQLVGVRVLSIAHSSF